KRLGLYANPIIIVNIRGYFDPMLELLDRAISERFMDARHRAMWTVVDSVDEVLDALASAEGWSEEARAFAVPRKAGAE
ncbi:MAG TPA: LOG family protein, partial [Thermoanaerobaculia bacterium]|nr:LOG family protein [Thermoanaerobaculia bacterium]